MMKLSLCLLVATSASWPSWVSAGAPRSMAAGIVRGHHLRNLEFEEIAAGTSFVFDPPIPFTSYLGDPTCSGSVGPKYSALVNKVENLAYGEFCITDSITFLGEVITYYTKLDEITCTPWGIFERYSDCTNDTCSDCLEKAVSYFQLDDVMSEPEGHCYDFTYSFDPSSFDMEGLISVGFSFDNTGEMTDENNYFNLIASQSCIAAQVLEIGDGDGDGDGTKDEVDRDDTECQTIPEILCDTDGYSVLCDLLSKSELSVSAINDVYTLFAPNDLAFNRLYGSLTESLSEEQKGSVLFYHMTPGLVKKENLGCGSLLAMYRAGDSRTKCREGKKIQQGGGNRKNNLFPTIEEADILACNGVIHLVSEVMLPNFVPAGFIEE